jgi:hypothetical protein
LRIIRRSLGIATVVDEAPLWMLLDTDARGRCGDDQDHDDGGVREGRSGDVDAVTDTDVDSAADADGVEAAAQCSCRCASA